MSTPPPCICPAPPGSDWAFVRLFITPAIVGVVKTLDETLATVQALTRDAPHEFWQELPALGDGAGSAVFARVWGPRQVNDAYLIELARGHKGRLLTFDQRLQRLAAGLDAVEIIAP